MSDFTKACDFADECLRAVNEQLKNDLEVMPPNWEHYIESVRADIDVAVSESDDTLSIETIGDRDSDTFLLLNAYDFTELSNAAGDGWNTKIDILEFKETDGKPCSSAENLRRSLILVLKNAPCETIRDWFITKYGKDPINDSWNLK